MCLGKRADVEDVEDDGDDDDDDYGDFAERDVMSRNRVNANTAEMKAGR